MLLVTRAPLRLGLLRFLVGQQLLSGLFDLLEQPPMIAGTFHRLLQLFAEPREPLQPLLVGEVC